MVSSQPMADAHTATAPLLLWLRLGRLSNLPTVWSNAMAAMVITAEPATPLEPLVALAVLFTLSCIYVAGMFLNDVFDMHFDALHRPERPLPSGLVSRRAVVIAALTLIALALSCTWLVDQGGALARERSMLWLVLLVLAVVAYDVWHKRHAATVVLMGLCRALSYLFAASMIDTSIPDAVLVLAAAVFLHTVALTLCARTEHLADSPREIGPLVLLAAPPMLLLLEAQWSVWLWACLGFCVLALWQAGQKLIRRRGADVGDGVALAIASMVLLDALAVAAQVPHGTSIGALLLVLCCFPLTRLLQRVITAS